MASPHLYINRYGNDGPYTIYTAYKVVMVWMDLIVYIAHKVVTCVTTLKHGGLEKTSKHGWDKRYQGKTMINFS